MSWDVIAVRYGNLRSTKAGLFLNWSFYGEPDGDAELDYFFYVLRDGDRTVLIDTGFEPGSGERRGRTCLCPPAEALQRLGADPAAVTDVVVSHLHYDHVGNLDMAPAARVHVPARELEFWGSPVARHAPFAHHVDDRALERLAELERAGRVRRFGGRGEVLPGIEAITVGGHSPGQQVFVVDDRVILASDAVHLYRELDERRPFAVAPDLVAMYEAYELLLALSAESGAAIVPGHDPEVATRYGDVPGCAGLAYRIA